MHTVILVYRNIKVTVRLQNEFLQDDVQLGDELSVNRLSYKVS